MDMNDSCENLKSAILYLSRYSTAVALGQQNVMDLQVKSEKRFTLLFSLLNTRNHAVNVKKNKVRVDPLVEEYFQTILVSISERLADHIRQLTDLFQNVPVKNQSVSQSLVEDIVVMADALTWFLPHASIDVGDRKCKENLLLAGIHILTAILDIVRYVTSGRNQLLLLKQLTRQSIQAFIFFLDRIQEAELTLNSNSGRHILDLSTDAVMVAGSRRASNSTIGSVVYPDLYKDYPYEISAAWKRPPSIAPRGSIDEKGNRKEVTVTLERDYDKLVLPVEIARGLISRKISMPPPYDRLNEHLQILHSLRGKPVGIDGPDPIIDRDNAEIDEKIEDDEPKTFWTAARISILKSRWGIQKWSGQKNCIVELYGDMLTVQHVKRPYLANNISAIHGHLRRSNVDHDDEEKMTTIIVNGLTARIYLSSSRWQEWLAQLNATMT